MTERTSFALSDLGKYARRLRKCRRLMKSTYLITVSSTFSPRFTYLCNSLRIRIQSLKVPACCEGASGVGNVGNSWVVSAMASSQTWAWVDVELGIEK